MNEDCTLAPPTPPMDEDYKQNFPTSDSKVVEKLEFSCETVCKPLGPLIKDGDCKLHDEKNNMMIDIPDNESTITPIDDPIDDSIFLREEAQTTAQDPLNDSVASREEVQNAMDHLVVPCLSSIKDLRKNFSKKYKLNFKVSKSRNRYLLAYKRKWDLLLKLEEWENTLNSSSPHEPYISVENKVDNSPPPEDFVYITQNILPESVKHFYDKNYLVGCECTRCTASTCDCVKNNHGGVDFPYDRLGRVIYEPGKPIYECNSNCYCSVSCRNRVVQRGRTVRVTIFRTANGCGWGVKTMDPVLKNQFVTEYVGELLTSDEAEERGKVYDHVGMTYLFDLDYNEEPAAYTIDAKRYGNISHFINHSCDPNLAVYGVWIETLHPQLPQIAFFATRDIKAGEELTFDYLMITAESSSSKASKTSQLIPCYCGSANCRKYM